MISDNVIIINNKFIFLIIINLFEINFVLLIDGKINHIIMDIIIVISPANLFFTDRRIE